jgi:predicted Zn-dependent protease
VGAHASGGPGTRPGTVRAASRPGPLVARVDLAEPPRALPVVRPRPGRIRRFVRRYGWRAYAVPLLTVVTLVALVDLALTTPEPATPDATAATAAPVEPSASSTPPAEPEPTAPAQGDAGPTSTAPVIGPQPYVEKGAGSVSVVDGTSAVYGTGPLRRFVVEVEDGIGVDGASFAAAVEATLSDPRSWGNGGRMSFQRVGAAEAATSQYEFKVSLVSPGSMEAYCPGVGTGGYTSCRYGERAVINLARWATAVPHYDGDIDTYRHYVVNHEVGHALGSGHVNCPGPGQVAPVMLQQTLGLQGCVKNAWPYP